MTVNPTRRVAKAAAMATTALCVLGLPSVVQAEELPTVAPVMECSELLSVDFTTVEGAPARLSTAELAASADGAPATCVVRGYVASDVNFEIRLPVEGWTQRFLMLGCGGYCGGVDADPATSQNRVTAGCTPLEAGEFVTASTDLGHTRSATWFPDGLWALDNPGAVIDFAYAGMHKSTLISKAIIEAFYGQPQAFAYYVGCSDGGREGLQEVQRFPDDFDGYVIGAPVIDEVTTNTVYHAWGIRTNTGSDGGPILTAAKIPVLHDAVVAACGDAGGLVQDPRACAFDPATLLCDGGDAADCLTQEQVDVVGKLWHGPVTEDGVRLAPGAMPVGSEPAWIGTMVPPEGETEMSHLTLGDGAWAYDFPNYMASFDAPTGITYANMEFTSEAFDRLHELSGLYDPTDPDLADFAAAGGKLILWTGWADSGVSPYIALNYWSAVGRQMGVEARDNFMTFYGFPGVYHCAAGPRPAAMDLLSPLMAWVEDGTKPDEIQVDFPDQGISRPAWPQPSMAVHDGSGNVAEAASWQRADLPDGLPEQVDWYGLDRYVPGRALWCDVSSSGVACEAR